jgi:uncharacterized protein involved in outer membrane biogenesis
MLRFIKYLFLGLMILIVMTWAYFYFIFDVNQYKQQLSELLQDNLGLPIVVEGDIEVKMSLIPTVNVTKLRLNDPQRKDKPMATIGNMEISLALLPLLHEKIHIKTLSLKQVVINLYKSNKGQGNWQLLREYYLTPTAISNIVIPPIFIEDATINYNDQQLNIAQQLYIDNAELGVNLMTLKVGFSAEGHYQQQSFDVNFYGSYQFIGLPIKLSGKLQLGSTTLDISGMVGPQNQKQWLDLTLKLNASNLQDLKSFSPVPLADMGPIEGSSKIVATGNEITLTDINGDIAGSNIVGDINISTAEKVIQSKGDLQIKSNDFGQLLRSLQVTEQLEGGKFSSHFDVSMAGKPDIARLNGKAKLSFSDSLYSNGKDNDFVTLLAAGNFSEGIPLNCFIGLFDIKQGIATTNLLIFDTPGATVRGNGSINLVNNTLDLVLVPKAKGVSFSSLATNVRISGTIKEPRVLPIISKTGLAKVAVGVLGGGVGLAGVVGLEAITAVGRDMGDSPCVQALHEKGEVI